MLGVEREVARDDDVGTSGRTDAPETRELGERSVHALAGRSGEIGQVVLCERERDAASARNRPAEALGEVVQPPGDSFRHAVPREATGERRAAMRTPGEAVADLGRPGKREPRLDHRADGSLGDPARRPPDEVPGAQDIQGQPPAVRIHHVHQQPSRANHPGTRIRLALPDEVAARTDFEREGEWLIGSSHRHHPLEAAP